MILLAAKGKQFTHKDAVRLAKYDRLVFICGRYEGVDERVAKHLIDEELSIGPYVLTGGGPLYSTLSALLYIYNQAFYFNHMGYAAALGLCFALMILVVVLLQRRFVEREVY